MTVVKVRSLFAELGFRIKNMKQAQEFEDAVENIRAGMERMVSAARTSAVAVAAAGTALTVFVKSETKAASALQRTAEGLKINVEQFQALRFAHDQLNINQEETIDGYQKLSDRVIKAADGSKEYQRVLKKVGLSSKELLGMDLGSMYDKTMDAVAGLADPQQRLAALTGLFGETLARKLAPALAENGALLKKYKQLAYESGVVMSKRQVAALAAVNFQFTRMSAMFKAVRQELAIALLPVFDRTISRIWNWYNANRQLVRTQIVKFAEKLSDGIESLVNSLIQLNTAMGGAEGWAKLLGRAMVFAGSMMAIKFGSGLATAALGVKALVSAIMAAGGKVVATFILTIITAAIFALALGEVAGEARGAETAIGHLNARADKLHPALNLLRLSLNAAMYAIEFTAVAVEHFLLPALEKMKPLLIIVAGAVAFLVAWVAGFIVICVSALVVIATIVAALVQLGMALIHATELVIELAKWLATGMDPSGIQAVRDAAADLLETLLKFPGMETLVDALGGDVKGLHARIADLRNTKLTAASAADVDSTALGGLKNMGASWAAFKSSIPGMDAMQRLAPTPPSMGVLTPAAAGSGGPTTINIEQKNEFKVAGSMDERVGQKVAKQAGDATNDFANGLRNAARTGNR